MTTYSVLASYPSLVSPRCSRPASPAPLLATRSRDYRPPPHFRLDDLAPELQLLIFSHVADLPPRDLVAAVCVNSEWHEALLPHLYSSVSVTKDNRTRILGGLGLDYLSASELESRAGEADPTYVSPLTQRKVAALSHVRHLTIGDTAGAVGIAEAILAHHNLLRNVQTLSLAAPVFRHLVNSGLAAFGRPRSGSAFVGETLVSRLRPLTLHVHYPAPRGASLFDPVLLARVMAVLLSEWKPDTVEYHGVLSDFPPVIGAHTRINCGPCSKPTAWGDEQCSHAALVRMHLRRLYGTNAHDELLEAIAEGADPTDDDDLDPDDVPEAVDGCVEYCNVPCIAGSDQDAFLERTFAKWPAEVDVAQHVKFFP